MDGATDLCSKFARGVSQRRESGGKIVWAKYRRAMPPWADRKAIRAKWLASKYLTAKTGIKHSVDHIVPLIHPLVCGLHVEWNLEVKLLSDNVKKSNNWWPDMPNEQLRLVE
jgi:5-methylcytosine-specific restriction endonuclease McrA